MMFYKIPLDADLTNTSYRCKKDTESESYIEYNEGVVFDEWEEINETTAREIAPEWFKTTNYKQSQLDRIESTLAFLTADTVTAESIDTAITEGVNEV